MERLFATGQFADVVVRWERVPGGVSISFEASAQKQLAQVDILGNQALSRLELLKAGIAALDQKLSGSLPVPIDRSGPELMRRAMENAYSERGYPSAHVTATPMEDQGPVDVRVGFRVDEGPPTRIVGISTSGDPKMAPDALAEASGIHLGDILDRTSLAEASKRLRKVYQESHRYRAQVGNPRTIPVPGAEDQALVTIPVSAGPRIRFGFRGNTSFSDHDLREKLAFSPDDVLDGAEEAEMATRLTSYLQLAGFYNAKVSAQEQWSPDQDQLAVIFAVDEGLPLIVRSIQFSGAHHFATEKLVEQITAAVASAQQKIEAGSTPDFSAQRPVDMSEVDAVFPSDESSNAAGRYPVEPSRVYDEKAYRTGIAQIIEMYHAEGFLDVTASLPVVDIDETTRDAKVTISLAEGVQTFVGKVKLVSADEPWLAVDPEILNKVTLREGKPYSVFDEESSRQALLVALQTRGSPLAQAEKMLEKLEEIEDPFLAPGYPTGGSVVFTLSPGTVARVNSVIVKGTPIPRIASFARSRPWSRAIFNPEKVNPEREEPNRLAIFQRTELDPLDPDHVERQQGSGGRPRRAARWTFETGRRPRPDGPRVGSTFTWSNVANRGLILTDRRQDQTTATSAAVPRRPRAPISCNPSTTPRTSSGLAGTWTSACATRAWAGHVFNDLLGLGGNPRTSRDMWTSSSSTSIDLRTTTARGPSSPGPIGGSWRWSPPRCRTPWSGTTSPSRGLDQIISELSASDLVQFQFRRSRSTSTCWPRR